MTKVTLTPAQLKNPELTHEALQQAINSNSAIELASGTYHIGPRTLKVTKSITIKGLQSNPRDPRTRPMIIGSSPALYFGMNKFDCGIFNIAPGCTAEIKNLRLKHMPDVSTFMHGSSSIAYFVDNNTSSSLSVIHCEIDTAATSGISIDAINGLSANSDDNPITHHITIKECDIKGRPHTDTSDPLAGNYAGVKLGNLIPDNLLPTPASPVDMRRSRFEVSNCWIESAKCASVWCAFFDSDSGSEYNLTGNHIGYWRDENFTPLPTDRTRVGIVFLDPSRKSFPKGKLMIKGNHIDLWGYTDVHRDDEPSGDWSTGIRVRLANVIGGTQTLLTEISNNVIRFKQTSPPNFGKVDWANRIFDGILYEDTVVGGSPGTEARIFENRLSNHEDASPVTPPLHGISVRYIEEQAVLSRQKSGGHGQQQKVTSNLQVHGNHMTELTACHAQIHIGKDVHDWEFYGNQYGNITSTAYSVSEPNVALLLCDGSNNKFFEDFSGCDVVSIPGWDRKNPGASTTDGPGRVKLDADSNNNKVFVDYITLLGTAVDTMQVWDVNHKNTVALGLRFRPEKPPRPRAGRPEWPTPPELLPVCEAVGRLPIGIFWGGDEYRQPGAIFGELRSSALVRSHTV